MQLPMKIDDHKIDESMEERLARVGAKIDDLIDKAGETRRHVEQKIGELKRKEEVTLRKSEEAMEEFKIALDFAWDELDQAWKEIKLGTKRAAKRLSSE
jgi:hypothetical protein